MTDTPMMQQYRDIKSKCGDAVLFFRMGDFYEMFLDDAREMSRVLDLTLTQRQGVPMCGLPYHSATSYLRRLLALGYRVAICEQLPDEAKSKGLLQRQVVETLSPGTVLEESFLERSSNNYLLALNCHSGVLALAYVDLSTGEFSLETQPCSGDAERLELLRYLLLKLNPREVLVPEDQRQLWQPELAMGRTVNLLPPWYFDPTQAWAVLCRHFGVSSLKGLGFVETDLGISSAAVIIGYVGENCPNLLANITSLRKLEDEQLLQFDSATLRNLEIVANLQDGGAEYTLSKVVNLAQTAMGYRCLRRWLLQPLHDCERINARLLLVEQLQCQPLQRQLAQVLQGSPDLERLVGRLGAERAHARDLLGIAHSLACLREVIALLEQSAVLAQLFRDCATGELAQAEQLLRRAIHPDAPILFHEGGLIAAGFSPELDRLRQLRDGRERILEEYLEEEKKLSGLSSLKLKNNRLIGYFFEIGRGKQQQLPGHFMRRQSMVNCERFTTARLTELERQLGTVAQELLDTEERLFLQLRQQLRQLSPQLRQAASALAQLDALLGLALRAALSGYVKPEIYPDQRLVIKGGRHPVVEHYLGSGQFISNDLQLGPDYRFVLLSGPNMAGKSTFLRQNALLVYLAQCGSFVPADHAEIGLVDRIFCRVGAADNLARGESTFMVEMQESARILNLAGEKSLVVMDEVGRGTSTEDGLAIARSISEYLLDHLGSRTLFATHYHQLTRMQHPQLRNLSMAVDDSQQPILFLKKVKEGAALSSYGLHVAALAGVPRAVVKRAQQLLDDQEQGVLLPRQPQRSPQGPPYAELLQELDRLDLNQLTPLEALCFLHRWQQRLAGRPLVLGHVDQP